MSLKKILTYSILGLTAIGGFFGNVDIDTNLENTSVISFSLETNSTYAAGPCQTGQTPEKDDCTKADGTSVGAAKMYNEAIDLLNLVLGIITVIVSPAIMFAGWLMSPDWTSGDLFGLRAPMYSLWVTVSNIVYFIYAVLLIIIALGTMFGQDKFSYKVMLPKLALGILMVPFTWWFVQWTISIASVVTAAVITIPNETMYQDANKESKLWTAKSIPKTILINETASGAVDKTPKCPTDCTSPEIFLRDSAGMYGYMMVYAYSIFKFQEVKELNTATDILKAGVGILHQGIIAAIMFIVFGLLTLALVAMLLVRAIKLWVYAIFSPLFTFRFVAGSNLLGGDKDDSFTIKEFIGLAFVPAIVGLTLSFGLIMVNAVSSAKPASGANAKTCTAAQLKTKEGCTLLTIMGNANNTIVRKIENHEKPETATTVNIVKFGEVKMEFRGQAGAAKADDEEKSASMVKGVLDSAGGIFGTIIIDIIALIFIWMAFMAAKGVSKAVESAIQPFEEMGNKIGGLAKNIPKYTPIPGLNISASGIGKVIEKKEQGMISDRQTRDANSVLGRWGGLEASMSPATLDSIKKLGETAYATASQLQVTRTQLGNESDGNKLKGTADALNNFSSALGGMVGDKFVIKDPKEFKTRLKDGLKISNEQAEILMNDIINKKGVLDANYFKNETRGQQVFKGIYEGGSGGATTNSAAPVTNITINKTTGSATEIAADIKNGNTAGTINKKDLEGLLAEKIKGADGTTDSKKIGEIMTELKDFLKK